MGMGSTWPMATLASDTHLGSFRSNVGMGALIKLRRLPRVTSLAGILANVVAGLSSNRSLPSNRRSLSWGRPPLSVKVCRGNEPDHAYQECSAYKKTEQSLHFALSSSAFISHKNPLPVQTGLHKQKTKLLTISLDQPRDFTSSPPAGIVHNCQQDGTTTFFYAYVGLLKIRSSHLLGTYRLCLYNIRLMIR
jgi:hypothetical protein